MQIYSRESGDLDAWFYTGLRVYALICMQLHESYQRIQKHALNSYDRMVMQVDKAGGESQTSSIDGMGTGWAWQLVRPAQCGD
ncbi:MAG: hypothetical protein A2030_08415 [Chloroflexi bacterium RBG_19FT_COMBO_50_10]|nr:MAG: hypothetical protein A2Y53_04715 [Chloroflexi bacterium RBG_16_47_49]OGO65083.1 MAG: hypothetical protein A2030_08415 [Chloroflexi bacterium RBG_19FT_COMBO_50_10]